MIGTFEAMLLYISGYRPSLMLGADLLLEYKLTYILGKCYNLTFLCRMGCTYLLKPEQVAFESSHATCCNY